MAAVAVRMYSCIYLSMYSCILSMYLCFEKLIQGCMVELVCVCVCVCARVRACVRVCEREHATCVWWPLLQFVRGDMRSRIVNADETKNYTSITEKIDQWCYVKQHANGAMFTRYPTREHKPYLNERTISGTMFQRACKGSFVSGQTTDWG